jgi:lipopolysaccharide/colanic/teichoic acid biosynthesis glycosyltransferase
MPLTKLIATARRLWLRRPTPNLLNDLFTPAQMRKVLARERARADRTTDRFAVLSFSPQNRDLPPEAWALLVKVLQERLRVTDDLGWLDDEQLCAVLTGTGADGAWKVMEYVSARLEGMPGLYCTIYTYPPDGNPQERVLEGSEANGQVPEGISVGAIAPLFERSLPWWKRGLDVMGAAVGLVLLAPLFAVVAVAVKLTSPGPIFFLQPRSGRGGRPFVMWKFRTMCADAEARKKELLARNEQDGAAFKMKNDPRVTPLGRLLRVTSIDELPQLWNVLRGEMSLVGPRPLPCAETAKCADWQRQRLDATPGLTCIWQVSGRSRVSFADWVRMDVRYIRSRSLWQDLKLLVLTVPAVLLRRGAQ